jgi:hypothetical protein
MKIVAMANTSGTAIPTAIFTLANGTGYTVSSPNTATVTLAAATTAAVSTIPVVSVTATDATVTVNVTSDTAKLVLCFASQAARPFDAPILVSVGMGAGAGPVIGAVWPDPGLAGGVT